MRRLFVAGVSMFCVGIFGFAADMNGKYHINSVSLSVLVSTLGILLTFLGIFFALEVLVYTVAEHSSKAENQRKELFYDILQRLAYQAVLFTIYAFSCAVTHTNKDGRISNIIGLDQTLVKLTCILITLTASCGILYFMWKMIKSALAYSDSETSGY